MRRWARLLPCAARWQVLGLIACAIVNACFELIGVGSIMPLMALAGARTQATNEMLLFWAFVVLFSLGAVNGLNALWIWASSTFANQQQSRLSQELYRAYLTRGYEWHLRQHTATLGGALDRVQNLADCVFLPIVTVAARALTCCVLVLLLLWVHPLATLTGAGCLVSMYALVYARCRRQILVLAQEEHVVRTRSAHSIADSFSVLTNLQLTGQHTYFQSLHGRAMERMTKLGASRVARVELPRVLIHGFASSAMLCLIVYLQLTLAQPERMIPLVSVFALACYRMLPSLQQCLASAMTLEASRTLVDAVLEDLEFIQDIGPPRPPAAPLVPKKSVGLREAQFRYPRSSAPVLEGCSLNIRVGTRVAFIGATGSGKTTILALLMGLLEPQSGTLLLDEVALGEQQRNEWQRSIGYVPQEVNLVEGTVAQNIALGVEAPCAKRLREVAEVAVLSEFVASLPACYDTPLGAAGVRISGGQRQRIGLARALYADPAVLVLDEATSSLDTQTEKAMMHNLARLQPPKTVIMVAHRLSTVRECEHVFVVEGGRIVAQGTCGEVAESCPAYQELAPVAASAG